MDARIQSGCHIATRRALCGWAPYARSTPIATFRLRRTQRGTQIAQTTTLCVGRALARQLKVTCASVQRTSCRKTCHMVTVSQLICPTWARPTKDPHPRRSGLARTGWTHESNFDSGATGRLYPADQCERPCVDSIPHAIGRQTLVLRPVPPNIFQAFQRYLLQSA